MTDVIITGANGLIGSSCCKLLENEYRFIKFDISDPDKPVDITDADSNLLLYHPLSIQTSLQHGNKLRQMGMAYVNVKGTENLVAACNETGKHIPRFYVYVSEKNTQYIEDDAPIN
jgi:dTDP-4-dehydrorhamnose reductase